MKNKTSLIVAGIGITSLMIAGALAINHKTDTFSIERASLFKDHGLDSEAKAECIQILTSKKTAAEKATAYYLLGLIAFDQNRTRTAFETWTKLTKEFPDSKEAKEVANRNHELAQIVGENQRETLDNATAQSYLSSAEFWSNGKGSSFTIDSSWIPKVETAYKWYDKMIQEFPNTTAAKVAYEEKMRTTLGWTTSGEYREAFGIKKDSAKYTPILLSTFAEYEKAFPNSSSLQAFRYQIAQCYWGKGDWSTTREWLNTMVKKSEGEDSFYGDLARRRLEKVEY
jgi:TolA-binding protein